MVDGEICYQTLNEINRKISLQCSFNCRREYTVSPVRKWYQKKTKKNLCVGFCRLWQKKHGQIPTCKDKVCNGLLIRRNVQASVAIKHWMRFNFKFLRKVNSRISIVWPISLTFSPFKWNVWLFHWYLHVVCVCNFVTLELDLFVLLTSILHSSQISFSSWSFFSVNGHNHLFMRQLMNISTVDFTRRQHFFLLGIFFFSLKQQMLLLFISLFAFDFVPASKCKTLCCWRDAVKMSIDSWSCTFFFCSFSVDVDRQFEYCWLHSDKHQKRKYQTMNNTLRLLSAASSFF